MHVPVVELHDAASLEEATNLLGQLAPNASLLAGGTDLLVDLKTGRLGARHLITIHRVAELRGVSKDESALRIGAMTTLSELNSSPLLTGSFAALRDATSQMAGPQIRNVATVGGNVAAGVPCADLPPVLSVMNAGLTLRSAADERRLEIDDFFIGPRETARRPHEILTEIAIPHPGDRFGAAYSRFGLRDGNAVAVAGVAAGLWLTTEGVVRDARITLSAVAPVPQPAREAARLLIGRSLDGAAATEAAAAAMEAAQPISDVRGTADYRRELVGVLARRALALAAQRAAESEGERS